MWIQFMKYAADRMQVRAVDELGQPVRNVNVLSSLATENAFAVEAALSGDCAS